MLNIKILKSFIRSFILFIGKIILILKNLYSLFGIAIFQKKECSAFPLLIVSIRDFNHGRYGYQLVRYFHDAGFNIIFYRSFLFLLKLHGYDRLIWSLPRIRVLLFSKKPLVSYNWLNLHADTLKNRLQPKSIYKINIDYFELINNYPNAFRLPYFVHPRQWDAVTIHRKYNRKRILFYGEDDLPFKPEWIHDYFGMISRSEVYNYLDKSDIRCFRPNCWEDLVYYHTIRDIEPVLTFINSKCTWIPFEEWCNILSSYDFFIAAPGVMMPFSHNVIEAMSQATIPVLQYGYFFSPALESGVNCVHYQHLTDLYSQIKKILQMPFSEIEEMRLQVANYYASNILPQAVISKFHFQAEDELNLMFNAEELSLQLT